MFDQQFYDAVLDAARHRAATIVERGSAHDGLLPAHRELMRDAKVVLSVAVADSPRPELLASARERIQLLRAAQSGSGLFDGGDNVQSPPDSAFTINDACDAYALTEPRADEADIRAVRGMLEAIIRSATGALLVGGVHTPNHRWELSAALGRIHRSFPDQALVHRIDDWLAEGIDIDHDGLYSERSPNYAAHVTNPSLRVLARILDRPQLAEIVHRNLDATLPLLRPDDTVETVQSRRQDQNTTFPLGSYLVAFRSAAIATGRGDFADAARRAAAHTAPDPEVLAEGLLDPRLFERLPEPTAKAADGSYHLRSVSLAGRRSRLAESVVYAGSDYSAHGRVRSGLANNPTFCRLFAGEVILDSVRLSRAFFDVGPFRPSVMRPLGDDVFVLGERVDAAYYQPLAPAARNDDGRYELADDGRFSASMSFSARASDLVTMTTSVTATLRDDGIDLSVSIDSPTVPWSMEFAFREGGEVEGGVADADGSWLLASGRGAYRVGASRVAIDLDGTEPSEHPLPYVPGQDYSFLGATDAVSGVRVRVGGTAPARFTVRLTAEQLGDDRGARR